MPRKVKRGCSPRRSRRRANGRKSLTNAGRRKGCGNNPKRRQSRRSMRGGYNEKALQEVLDAALRGGGLNGSRLNGGQGGGSRRRRTKRVRRSRRSMRGGTDDCFKLSYGVCGTIRKDCMLTESGEGAAKMCIPNPNFKAPSTPASTPASNAASTPASNGTSTDEATGDTGDTGFNFPDFSHVFEKGKNEAAPDGGEAPPVEDANDGGGE